VEFRGVGWGAGPGEGVSRSGWTVCLWWGVLLRFGSLGGYLGSRLGRCVWGVGFCGWWGFGVFLFLLAWVDFYCGTGLFFSSFSSALLPLLLSPVVFLFGVVWFFWVPPFSLLPVLSFSGVLLSFLVFFSTLFSLLCSFFSIACTASRGRRAARGRGALRVHENAPSISPDALYSVDQPGRQDLSYELE